MRSVRSVGISFLPRNSQNPQNLAAWVWQGCHTLLICAHPCHLWEALLCKRFCVFGAFRGSFFTACFVGAAETAALPGLSAWVWQGCHTLLHLCASVSSVGVLSLQEVLCIRCIPWELLHRLFGWCSSCSGKRQSRAETAAPPGGIHRSSVQISPFHLEPSLLHVLPVLWVRLRHYLRFVNPQPREHDCRRCERHRHAVVVVGVDRL